MSRALTPWLLGWVLLASLGPTLAFACKPEPPTAWTVESANGRFTLSMKGTGLTLRTARGKVLWQQDVAYLPRSQAHVSPSGRYVAAVRDSGAVTVYGPKGNPVGTWNVLDALTRSEQRRLPRSPCGAVAVDGASFKGEVLELKVLAMPLRLDPETGRLTRELPRNAPKLSELIQRWRSAPEGSEREEVLDGLALRALHASKPGALPELRKLWQEMLATPGLPLEERATAVRGLWRIATDEELRALGALPDAELGAVILEALEARLPREAEAHALRLLENPSTPEGLRKAALLLLLGRTGAVAERGLALGLRDASGQVRGSVLLELSERPPTAKAFEQVLPLCDDPEPEVLRRAVEHQLRLLESPGPERKALLAALRRADTQSRLEPFPEGWIILGGLAALEGRQAQALRLYERGVEGLASAMSVARRPAGSMELLFEGLLQLAIEAKKRGRPEELSRRVHDVLSLPAARDTQVSAPAPNRYARGVAAPGAGKRKPAMLLASELIARPKPPHRYPRYDPFKLKGGP